MFYLEFLIKITERSRGILRNFFFYKILQFEISTSNTFLRQNDNRLWLDVSVTFECADFKNRHVQGEESDPRNPLPSSPLDNRLFCSLVCLCVYARRLICRDHNANVLSDSDRFCLTHSAFTSGLDRFGQAEKDDGHKLIHAFISSSTEIYLRQWPFSKNRS